MSDTAQSLGCPCDESNNLSMCYVEGSEMDREVFTASQELNSSVWTGLAPPTKYQSLHTPAVTARKIDIMKALLSGKAKPATPQVFQPKPYCDTTTVSRASTRVHYEK